MTSILRKTVFMTLLSVATLQPLTAGAWTTHVSCKSGLIGSLVDQATLNSFTQVFAKTLYSLSPTGTQSCKMGITKGSDGWGEWGAISVFPTKLYSGSKLWIRLSMYTPDTFDYTAAPWLKFMRVHTASATNNNMGYLDLYKVPDGMQLWDPSIRKDVYGPFTFYYEGKAVTRPVGKTSFTNVPSPDNIVKNKWETYEIYYSLDKLSKDEGGNGEVKIWKNNVLIAHLTDQQTLVDAQTYAESFYLFTYWNGANGAPATQSLYIDDVIMTNETPANRDAAGNPFIGYPVPGTVAPIKPAPPTNVTVQ